MKVKAYGYNLHEAEMEIIKKMAQVLTTDPIEIIDVRSFGGECIDPDDILLIYGQRAIRETAAARCRAKLVFPEIYKLDKTLGESQIERQTAYEQLLKFKEMLDSGQPSTNNSETTNQAAYITRISEESLSNLNVDQVQKIETSLRIKGQTAWVGTTQDGKTIRVSIQPESGSADINITFAELYCMKELMEAFRVKELEIVYKQDTDHGRPTYSKHSDK